MELIILGLLMTGERTLYELNKALSTNISLFYSASLGSISSALTKLQEKQWAVMRETVERGRNKKLFRITAAGEAAFRDWLASPIPAEKVREPALARLFFLGHLAPDERIAVIERHLSSLAALADTLAQLAEQGATLSAPPELRDQAAFQWLTLRYGTEYYAFSIDWYRRLLQELKEADDATA